MGNARARNGGKRARVTLHEVAEEAGTSRSTASRALGGHGYVAEHIRERVRAAAERLGYVPDVSARTLKGRSSRVIGLLVSDLRNQFYAQLAAGVEQTLSAAGYQVVLVDDHGSEERAADGARAFLAMRADGVLLAPVGRPATEVLVEHGTPVVEVDRRSGVRGCDAVAIDSESGSRAAVEHLLELGHRKIAVVVDETKWATGKDRLKGYRAALREAGVPYSRRRVLDLGLRLGPRPGTDDEDDAGGTGAEDGTGGPDDMADTYSGDPGDGGRDPAGAVAALLDADPDVTAVFAANNVVAELVWQVLKQRGAAVPEDYSVVSFDDQTWMRMVEPKLTAVRQPVYDMGRRAAALLLERTGGGPSRSQSHILQPELVVRGSTAPPARG
ncbi:LacI family DNA-binding transcriptional regulator [Streptomyces marispadix]|uniref:LacI family transcriptional regulator n=1 Tax=Streptomyces marispadix TaxID=2922868 RepID=A0ABS9T531_9ACTN|nr:LacI family DNA-binding transcriptional regulator [Streptomyces marispadix]MCH6163670.1 LacI family transcriptional regulator [Streptomyces marispadix]